MENNKPPRVDDNIPPRVETQQQTSINNSTDATTLKHINSLTLTHNKLTRANKPVIITQEPDYEKENIQKQHSKPRCSPRQRILLQTPKTPIFVSQSAINETLRHAVETYSPMYVPDKLKKEIKNKNKRL